LSGLNQNCLFVRASSSACGEVQSVRDTLAPFGIGLKEVEWLSHEDFCSQIAGSEKFKFIYLGAHADSFGFGEIDATALHAWEHLANAICASDCIIPGGTLFLGCCRGGIKTVALKILTKCPKIDYICGPNWNTKGSALMLAFSTFISSRERDKQEPAIAAERATHATGQKFTCHDRQELEAEVALMQQLEYLEGQQQFQSKQIASLHADLLSFFQYLRASGLAKTDEAITKRDQS
jgi:hypothetical protein